MREAGNFNALPISHERELANLVVNACSFAFIFGFANSGDLGMGVNNAGDGYRTTQLLCMALEVTTGNLDC